MSVFGVGKAPENLPIFLYICHQIKRFADREIKVSVSSLSQTLP
jgi:hypothetical protein